MRIVHGLFLCVGIAGIACHPTASDLKVIANQREQFRSCIISTVMEVYASSKPPREAVEAFANEMAAKAPSTNKVSIDKEFTDYVHKYGCDPSRKATESNAVGNMIVAEWFVSPHNPYLLGLTSPK